MPTLPTTAYFELAPDWLCEVLSPSTEARDRTDKLEIYGRAGVPWVWFINPERQTLEILERRDASWILCATHRADAVVRAKPFDAIEFALADLWPPASDPG